MGTLDARRWAPRPKWTSRDPSFDRLMATWSWRSIRVVRALVRTDRRGFQSSSSSVKTSPCGHVRSRPRGPVHVAVLAGGGLISYAQPTVASFTR